MKVWQIATGEPGRDYRELFFDHDIMILGPSHLGSAMSGAYAVGSANSDLRQVHSFANNPKPGDRVLMRFAHEVIGVGQIPDGDDLQYRYEKAFKCVYGWNLCHCRRVAWARNFALGELAGVFREAKQKPSFTEIHEKHIVEMVRSIDASCFDAPIKDMPAIKPDVYEEDELGIELFQAGVSNKNIEDILGALHQADRLCSWYKSKHCGKERPSENEVVSHIILPLFLGLGWSHQQVAVEWKSVDTAFFKATPTVQVNCVMVLEAKGLGQSLGEVLEQPLGYVKGLELTNVRYILTTDGANLFVYGKSRGEWSTHPIGYINVQSLQKQYILPRSTDLVNTLVMLQPISM
jgi:hypothetical protein